MDNLECSGCFDVVYGLDKLHEKRQEWAEIEKQHEPLLNEIKYLETNIKGTVRHTGEEAKGQHLSVTWVKGREMFDGKKLYETCQNVLNNLVNIKIDPHNMTTEQTIIINAVMALGSAIQDLKTVGERTLRISEIKKDKKNELPTL